MRDVVVQRVEYTGALRLPSGPQPEYIDFSSEELEAAARAVSLAGMDSVADRLRQLAASPAVAPMAVNYPDHGGWDDGDIY